MKKKTKASKKVKATPAPEFVTTSFANVTSEGVYYAISNPDVDLTVLTNAPSGRDARTKVLSLFRGLLDNSKLKRDELSSTRVLVKELPAKGRVATV